LAITSPQGRGSADQPIRRLVAVLLLSKKHLHLSSLGKLAQGTVCKILVEQAITPSSAARSKQRVTVCCVTPIVRATA
jgi:hypothetical protein